MLPTTNSDGLPVVELTDEQKYGFDARGWILFPGVLPEDELDEYREFAYRLKNEPETVPEAHRSFIGGPFERLTDHSLVVGFMNQFVAHPRLGTENGYGFRQDGGHFDIRAAGNDNYRPHGGSGMFNRPGNSHVYHCLPGNVQSGLTRVVWEFNPVRHGDGTLLLTGSHKAAFPLPEATKADRDSSLWDTYECPAGSMLIFTEALTHTGTLWRNEDHDRIVIFTCYNTVASKWHSWQPHPDHVASMPAKRQTLYRGVHAENNEI